MLKEIIKKTYPFKIYADIRDNRALIKWYRNGKPLPPPHLAKQGIIKEYAKRFSVDTLVETGTYLGAMVESALRDFQKIVSIEVDESLYRAAAKKFDKYPHVTIMKGDSSDMLGMVLRNVTGKALFWLDAHYSEGITGKGALNTPIMRELGTILDHSSEHVTLIDDARCFTGMDDYPTIDALKDYVKKRIPEVSFYICDDIIRIHR